MGPTALIDFNFQYYGSSLRGAGDGAKMIIGKGRMYPVVVNEKLDLYWFPSKSPLREDCIWLALHHIKDYIDVGEKRTKIIFSNGSTITIDMSRTSFDNKVQRAYKLKGKLESRTRDTPLQVNESKEHYHIAKSLEGPNFEV